MLASQQGRAVSCSGFVYGGMNVHPFTVQETAVLQRAVTIPQGHHPQPDFGTKDSPSFAGGKVFSYPSSQIPENSESGVFILITLEFNL